MSNEKSSNKTINKEINMDTKNNPIRARLKARGFTLPELAIATGKTLQSVSSAARRGQIPPSLRADLLGACGWNDAELNAACNEIRDAARAKMGLAPIKREGGAS